jgi:DeoR/GlpR family transcriptional regulator of sugar metabolism
MVEFINVPKKMPFKRRSELVSAILNKRGEVSVEDLVLSRGVTPNYARAQIHGACKWILN